MNTFAEEIPPEIKSTYPSWYRKNGSKVKQIIFNEKVFSLKMIYDSGKITIRPAPGWQKNWYVGWVKNTNPQEKSGGCRNFTSTELQAAFSLLPNFFCKEGSEWILDRYPEEVDSCAEGLFVQHRNFLSIPSIGTGHDGDPSICIFIDRKTQNAVKEFLELFNSI